MTTWSGCTRLAVGLLLLHSAFGLFKKSLGIEKFVFEATYRVVTESDLSSKQFDDAFKPILASNERIEVLTLQSVRLGDQEGGKGDRSDEKEVIDLKQRGRSLLQSAGAQSTSAASDAAAAAAALNPGASIQGTGKKPSVSKPDQVTLAPGQSIQERIGFGLQQHGSSNTQGSPGASLWDTSVAAAQARGKMVSLYTPPAQTPHPAKLYTGFGLEQEPAQAWPLADSFLQIDRIDFAAPAPAPGAGELSVRTLKQGDGDRPPHYWDSAQGTDLAAEAPLLDWGVPQSSAVGASPAAMPAEASPQPARHYWEAPSPSSEDAPQGSNPQIFEHRWRMPNQAFGKVPEDGTIPAQVYTASISALALEHADISDPASVPVRLSARSGRVQAASVQDALAAASASSSAGDVGAAVGAPASSRRLLIWQAGSEEIKDDAWAREGWDGNIQAAMAAEAEQGKAQGEQGKVQLEDVSDMVKDTSKEGEAKKEDKAEGENSGASDSKVADTDQKVLISQSADRAAAKTDPAKDKLQDTAMPAGGQLPAKPGPGQQLRKKKQPGSEAGSSAANVGGSASSARVSTEVGQPGNRDVQNGQDLAGAAAKTSGTQGGIQQASRRVPARQQGKGAGRGRLPVKASADAAQAGKRKAENGARAGAATQQLSQEDLKSVTSLLSMIRENAGDKDGMAQLFRPKAMDYIHRAIVQAIVDAKAEATPCKQPPREELPQDLVELLTGYKQVPRTKEGKAGEAEKEEDKSLREYTLTFRVTTPEAKFGELLLNPHVSRIVKENLRKKGVRVSSVTHDNVVRVMRDGSRWMIDTDKPQNQVTSSSEPQTQTQGSDQQQKQAQSNKQQPKQPQRGSRRLLQAMLSAVPDEALPARLVSAIKAAAGFVRLRSL